MHTRFRVLLAGLAVAAAALAPAATAGGGKGDKHSEQATRYYLSVGDSLAVGFLTGAQPFSNQGYADQLYAALAAKKKHLALVKLGCPGEKTSTMVAGTGSPCLQLYPHGSQLAEAVAFIKAHRKQVRLVTIDIGANDVLGCAPTFDQTCVTNGLGAISTNLPVILAALRGAGRKHLRIAGMNYYNPFLAAFPSPLATLTTQLMTTQFNPLLEADYAAFHAKVADVETAFSTTDFTPQPPSGVPLNVTRICTWTSMCSSGGTNIHPNVTGYGVIAGAFQAVLK